MFISIRKNQNFPRWISYLFLLAWIVNSIAPSLAASSDPERFLLCTSQGYQWVEIESSDAKDSASGSVEAKQCIFCLSPKDQDFGEDLLSIVISRIALTLSQADQQFYFSHQFAAKAVSASYSSRAPPIV